MPAGTKGAFCYRKEVPERLAVSRTAYVTVGNVKLTGLIEFDCGADGRFEDGVLFEDVMLGGKWRQRGESISRNDLLPRIGKRDLG